MDPLELDPARIAWNVRNFRMSHDLKQADLAQRAGIGTATIIRIESGKRVRIGTLEKVAAALQRSVAILNSLREFEPTEPLKGLFIHRAEGIVWFAEGDRRRKVPADSQDRIQKEAERIRLGRSGLVDRFYAFTFAMPNGPGMTFTELYGPIEWPPSRSYRDCVVYCMRGAVSITLDGETIELSEGDAVGHSAGVAIAVKPLSLLSPGGRAPLIQYVGANRIGQIPTAHGGRKRVRVFPAQPP